MYQLPNYIGNKVIPSEVQLLPCCRKCIHLSVDLDRQCADRCIRCLGSYVGFNDEAGHYILGRGFFESVILCTLCKFESDDRECSIRPGTPG